MSKELFVSSTPHETKVAIVEDDQLSEIYYERENEYTLAGSIYKGRVTRVLPGMQSAFVNVGLERDAFLYVSDFLLEEEADDVEGLDQVVSRSRVIESPSPEEHPQGQPEEGREPLEADEIIPPAEASGVSAEAETATAGEEQVARDTAGEEQDREGARKWRGRRRRRGGRGRFQDREDREERGQRAAEEAPPRQEHATPRHEVPRHEPLVDQAPIVLPGESISKYQPQAASTAAAAPKPVPQNTARPSTEYSFNPSEFSPDSMVLPGESISKYRGQSQSRPQASAEPAVAKPQEHGFLQDEASAGPIPRGFEQAEEDHPADVLASEEQHAAEPPVSLPSVSAAEEHDVAAEAAELRFDSMNVASTFGGDAEGSSEQSTEPEDSAPSEASLALPEQHAAPPTESKPWQAAGAGVVEEEEIEEEESELPGFEPDADLAEYEELEEEVLGSGSEMVALGSEI